MNTFVRCTSRFLFVMILVAALPLLSPAVPDAGGPYLSALSQATAVSQATAAPDCNNKACSSGPRLSMRCDTAVGFNCKAARFDCGDTLC